jgi:DNA-binding CsgD family transcriptional regulator
VSKSRHLRLRELREAFRLVGECRDLGYNPEAWRRHAFRELVRLIGGRAAVGGEIQRRRPEGPLVLIQSVDEGLSPADRSVFLEYMHVHGPVNYPITANLKRLEGRLIGPVLEWAGTSVVAHLSPRLKQTLDGLREGDSEKQVAARLGISQPTAHEYVHRLYRHFGVSSRAERWPASSDTPLGCERPDKGPDE